MSDNEQLQAQIDANAILLITITALLKDDPRFSTVLQASYDGFMAMRLNHTVSQEYLDQLASSLASRLPQPLKELLR